MAEIVLKKELIVAEDMVLSTEPSVAQTRSGQPFTGTPLNAGVLPLTPTETVKARLDASYTKVEADAAIAAKTDNIDASISELKGVWFGPLANRATATQYVLDNNLTLLGGETYYDLALQLLYVWNNDSLSWKNIPITMDTNVSTGDIAATGVATYTIPGGFVASTLTVYLDRQFQTQGVDYTADASAGTITFTAGIVSAPVVISYMSFTAVRLGEYPRITITDSVASLPVNPTPGDVAYVYGAAGAQEMVKYVLPVQTGQANKFLTTDGTTAAWSTLTFVDVEAARDFAYEWARKPTGNVNDGVNPAGLSAFQEAERAKAQVTLATDQVTLATNQAVRAEDAAAQAEAIVGFTEAPIDGQSYARKDAGWVVVTQAQFIEVEFASLNEDISTPITVNALGDPLVITYTNGYTKTHTYDASNNVETVVYKDNTATVLATKTYTYLNNIPYGVWS